MDVRTLVMPAVLVVACGLPGGSAGAAPSDKPTVSPTRLPGGVAFRTRQAGWTAWSEQIGGRWWLLGRTANRTRLLAVPSSEFTHDPGVGRGAKGRPTVVYQQCGRSACELWTLDLGSSARRRLTWVTRVRRLDSAQSSEGSAERETHPRVFGGSVAFQTRVGGRWRYMVAPAARSGQVRRIAFGPRSAEVAGTGGGAFNLALGPKHLMGHWVMSECGSLGQLCGRMDIVGLASNRSQTIAEYSGGEDCSSDVTDLQFDGNAFDWQIDASGDASSGTRCPVFTRRDRYDPARPRR